jgi:simple sugar transport system ATP-binding protein/ribose transport system ATP-binding protein
VAEPAHAPAQPALLEVDGVHKRFGGVHAVRGVTLAVAAGTIRGLVGENGAGKSTLGKMIAGLFQPDEGQISLEGEPIRFRSPRDALRAGIAIITQELAIVPTRTVIENVFLGVEDRILGVVVSKAELRRRYRRLAEATGFAIHPDETVGELRVAQQIRVEIMRALARNARLVVMDEVTAALTIDEAERLFEVIRGLRERGTTVIYISHFLDEVLRLVDDVTVMRDGSLVKTSPAADESPRTLVTAMLGRSLELVFPGKKVPAADAETVFEVEGVTRRGLLHGVSLSVRRGEIVGLAGLIGSGRTELARAVFGADSLDEGTIRVLGKPVSFHRPRDAVRAGVAMVPESRKEHGLMMRRSIVENVTLPHLAALSAGGVLKPRAELGRVREISRRLDVRASNLRAPVEMLSGGNQQKVLFSKWLFRPPRVLIADEPTRGVDVGAKQQIYQLIASLAAEGLGVLLISSELEEVLGLAHRVLVMREGRLVAEFDGTSATEEEVMQAAFGESRAEATEAHTMAANGGGATAAR